MRGLYRGSREKLDFPVPQNGGISSLDLREASQNLDFQVHRNSGTYSRKSRFGAAGNRAKPGFPDISKQRNVFAEVAILSSGKPAKNLDFEVHQNRRIHWWGVANSESGESPKIRHFRTIKRWNLVREAPVSSSAEPAIPTRNARIGRTGASVTGHSIRG